MLTAIRHGKAGRVRLPGVDASLSWRDVFRRNEDLLTSAIFGRVRYLSEHALLYILAQLVGSHHASMLGALDDIEFWPHLSGLEGRSFVEPDILMTFKNAIVMIEVKPPFGGDQSIAQWRAQIGALLTEFKQGTREVESVVHYVALGRNRRQQGEIVVDLGKTSGFFDLIVHCREWDSIFDSVPLWIADSEGTDTAVFEDLREAFVLFGLETKSTMTWQSLLSWACELSLSTTVLQGGNVTGAPGTHRPRIDPIGWKSVANYSLQHPMEIRT